MVKTFSRPFPTVFIPNYNRRLECVSGRAHANVRLHAAAGLCRAVERRCRGDGLAADGMDSVRCSQMARHRRP
jgi:hypothetical protein